jgi:hypothetical protein
VAVLAGCRSADVFYLRKGIIWFAISTVAELLQLVSLAGLLAHLISLIPVLLRRCFWYWT